MKYIILILLSISFAFGQGNIIRDLAPNTWYEVANSHLDQVAPNPLPPNNSGFGAIMSAWSGGAYDTNRERLIIWGGGHGDYSGNEVYVFDVETFTWTRLNDPSADVGGNESSGEYPDGTPRSRHTYNYIQYVSLLDRFCTFGGAGMYPGGQVHTNKTHAFNFDNLTWDRRADAISYGIGAFSAVDDSTGHVWIHGTEGIERSRLAEFDPIANTWNFRTNQDASMQYAYELTAAIDPNRRSLIAIGNGREWIWDISNPNSVSKNQLNTTGDRDIRNAISPGFDYDPVSDKMIGWRGGQDIYVLDLDTNEWTMVTGTGANPGSPSSGGTFGRFRYAPSVNAFILVNSTSTNVFFYKLGEGTGYKKPAAPENPRIRR